ncbi:MAG: transcription antitermination factor NusB [Oscillospiraceae bacterium]|nr:transcription antitermination factor NusB [Oscillospiraceae bacterium]
MKDSNQKNNKVSPHREHAFLILFEASFREDSPEELFQIAEDIGEMKLSERSKTLVKGVLNETQTLDNLISSYSPKRALSRIARTNLIILRMAVYELQHAQNLSPAVIVSEAVHLSEIYASPEDTSFINGILGKYVRNQEQ